MTDPLDATVFPSAPLSSLCGEGCEGLGPAIKSGPSRWCLRCGSILSVGEVAQKFDVCADCMVELEDGGPETFSPPFVPADKNTRRGSMNDRNAVTWSASVGGAQVRLTAELDPDGNVIGLSTAGYGLPGSALDALWRSFVKAWDLMLKPGRVQVSRDVFVLTDKPRVSLRVLQTFLGRMDETAGNTGDPLVPWAGGHADYFAKSTLARVGGAEWAGGFLPAEAAL